MPPAKSRSRRSGSRPGPKPKKARNEPSKASNTTTEKEKLEGGPAKKFGEFRERLDIGWEVKGVHATVKLTPECKYKGTHLNEAGEAEFAGGKMEGELEEVTLQQRQPELRSAVV